MNLTFKNLNKIHRSPPVFFGVYYTLTQLGFDHIKFLYFYFLIKNETYLTASFLGILARQKTF